MSTDEPAPAAAPSPPSDTGRLGAIRFGLAGKLVLFVALLLTALAAINTGFSVRRLRQTIVDEYRSKGTGMAHTLASSSVEVIQNGDSSTLQGFIDEFKKIEGVRYVYIVAASGEIIAHTFTPSFPDGLEKLNVPSGEQAEQIMELDEKGVYSIDIAVPILAGAIGVAHVGMDRGLVDRQVRSAALDSIGISCLALLAAIALAYFAARRVLRPIEQLTIVTTRIVESGDLTQKVEWSGSDEVGRLGSAFAKLVERLRDIPRGLQRSVADMSEAVNAFGAIARQQSAAVSRQASALTETNTTAQEIKQTSAVAASKAEEVLEIAGRAEEIGKQGLMSVDSSIAGMQEVQVQVKTITSRIGELIEKTLAIGEITDAVADLAEQSNVLAINAAIEAAKAGDAGRGFGVVAREIRGLADQSTQSTARVRSMIGEVQRAIRATVVIIEEGNHRIDTGLTQTRTSGESLRQLAEIVRDSSQAAKQIARSVSQQNVGVEQIFGALADLDRLMSETVEGLAEMTRASDSVKDVSLRLRGIVETYRV